MVTVAIKRCLLDVYIYTRDVTLFAQVCPHLFECLSSVYIIQVLFAHM